VVDRSIRCCDLRLKSQILCGEMNAFPSTKSSPERATGLGRLEVVLELPARAPLPQQLMQETNVHSSRGIPSWRGLTLTRGTSLVAVRSHFFDIGHVESTGAEPCPLKHTLMKYDKSIMDTPNPDRLLEFFSARGSGTTHLLGTSTSAVEKPLFPCTLPFP
jgi:hypothetical protein